MTPTDRDSLREMLEINVRQGLVETWNDTYNARTWNQDVLLAGCKSVNYEAPEEAAQNLAGIVADAILSALDAAGLAICPREPTGAMGRAARKSNAKDDEGEFPPLFDLLGFSGENKTVTVVDEAIRQAIAASPFAPQATETKGNENG